MSRPWLLSLPLLLALTAGCTRPVAPVLQPGDVVRPEVSFAPNAPWPAGGEVAVGVLLRVERPGGKTHYLMDEDVDVERAEMAVRVTFLDGERVVEAPRQVPLVKDC
jgi:hypothetical protein